MLDTLRLRLDNFEGPLPLLLYLIERRELEVTRVSVVAVADQYLALVAEAGQADLADIGEFVAAAARLLFIKSRALLPAPTVRDEDEVDDAEALARQIAEYRRFQSAAGTVGALLAGDGLAMPPQPLPRPRSAPSAVLPDTLRRAAKRLLRAVPSPTEMPAWPAIDFPAMRARLLARVAALGSTAFAPLTRQADHPLEVVTLFLALLELVRGGRLWARQEWPYAPIEIGTGAADADHA